MSKTLPKLPCSRIKVITLAAKHSVTYCKMPMTIADLNQLGGSWVVANERLSDIRRYFCHVEAKDGALHLEIWNWIRQKHHSTLVIYDDDTYEVISHTREGRGHTPAWNYFLKCATSGHFFKMPKEAEI